VQYASGQALVVLTGWLDSAVVARTVAVDPPYDLVGLLICRLVRDGAAIAVLDWIRKITHSMSRIKAKLRDGLGRRYIKRPFSYLGPEWITYALKYGQLFSSE
jgi:hypothetical protein